MNWELYEVWSVDEDGHEDLIDTTKSLKEAKQIAEANLTEYYACLLYTSPSPRDRQKSRMPSSA